MVTFGSFALHGTPPQEEGGKHQGPEARPKVKEHWGGPQRPPCSWNGQPAPAAFPEMVMGGRGRWLSPHPLSHRRLQMLSPSALLPLASVPGAQESTSPSLPPGWAWAGVAARPAPGTGRAGSPVCYMVQKKSPALARASGGGRILPPKSPTSTGRVQAPNWAPLPGLRGPWVRAGVP